MGNKIKRCISFDTKTDVLIDQIMEISNAQNVSDLFRILVQQECSRSRNKPQKTEQKPEK